MYVMAALCMLKNRIQVRQDRVGGGGSQGLKTLSQDNSGWHEGQGMDNMSQFVET